MAGQTVEVVCVRPMEERVAKETGRVFWVGGGVREDGWTRLAGVSVPRNVYVDMVCFDSPDILDALEVGKVFEVTGDWKVDHFNGRESLKVVVSGVSLVPGVSPVGVNGLAPVG